MQMIDLIWIKKLKKCGLKLYFQQQFVEVDIFSAIQPIYPWAHKNGRINNAEYAKSQ